MTEISRFNGNIKPFADDSLGTERTVFGAETQSDTLDDNINADFFRGWGIVGVNQLPTKQDFNAFAYTSTALTSYLYQRGIPEHNNAQEYFTGSITFEDGLLYKATQDNTGVLPSDDDGTNWTEYVGFTTYDAVTTYHANSIVRKIGTFELYGSIADGNVGNSLPNQVTNANWTYIGNLANIDATLDPATIAQIKAETDVEAYIKANELKHGQGVAKFWIKFDGTGTIAILNDYNVSSIVDNAVGDYTVNIDNDFSDADWCVVASCLDPSLRGMTPITAQTAGSVSLDCQSDSGANEFDSAGVYLVGFGELA